MNIGVVIVHHKDWDKTTACQKSFHNQDTNHKVTSYIYNADIANVGYGAACNVGFKALATQDRVIFVNNDTIAPRDFMEKMLMVDADFVCPKVVNNKEEVIYAGGEVTKTGPRHYH